MQVYFYIKFEFENVDILLSPFSIFNSITMLDEMEKFYTWSEVLKSENISIGREKSNNRQK